MKPRTEMAETTCLRAAAAVLLVSVASLLAAGPAAGQAATVTATPTVIPAPTRTWTPYPEGGCGDGVVQLDRDEECDDHNGVNGDGCDVNCTPSACGNGIVAPNENCDDGNARDGDCCSSTCALDPHGTPCTDGNVCNGTEACDGAGVCAISGTPLDCDDGIMNNEDFCDRERGCLHRSRCPGDCDGGTDVTIDELLRLVSIALGNESVRSCEVGDWNKDAMITMDEIMTAVNVALKGCCFDGSGCVRR
jgi:cysteine-rich repeat protein